MDDTNFENLDNFENAFDHFRQKIAHKKSVRSMFGCLANFYLEGSLAVLEGKDERLEEHLLSFFEFYLGDVIDDLATKYFVPQQQINFSHLQEQKLKLIIAIAPALQYIAFQKKYSDEIKRKTIGIIIQRAKKYKISPLQICEALYFLSFNKYSKGKYTLRKKVDTGELKFIHRSMLDSSKVLGSLFISITMMERIRNTIILSKKIELNKGRNVHVQVKLHYLFLELSKIEKKINLVKMLYSKGVAYEKNNFDNYFIESKDIVIFVLLFQISKMFFAVNNSRLSESHYIEKIEETSEIIEKTKQIMRQNISFFKGSKAFDKNWSNKLYINSLKYFSVLKELKLIHDPKGSITSWKLSVLFREASLWYDEVVQSILFYDNDDWLKIEEYLEEESSTVEWKSSFFTPIEFDEMSVPKKNRKNAFQNKSHLVNDTLIKNIIGLANTEGGVIFVGKVEFPDRVADSYTDHISWKNGHAFFDLGQELNDAKKTVDELVREFTQKISNWTDVSKEKLNGLFKIEELKIGSNSFSEKEISIYLIKVEKLSNPLYMVSQPDDTISIKLIKRAEAGICYVDPRENL